jgi:two-component system, sensor histidine kinase and response regulator
MKFLIIDDSAAVRELMVSLLTQFEHEAEGVYDVSSAITMLETWTPDIIFCDLMMPVLNGLDFLKYRGTHPTLQNIPVYILTGSADTEYTRDALELGAAGVVLKPFGRARILNIIQSKREES